MADKIIQIAIDGPAGAGKSTVARAVAGELGILYLDTGAMYRAIGLKALEQGISPQDEAAVSAMVEPTEVRIAYSEGEQQIELDGRDVTELIRTNEVSAAASAVSQWRAVRLKMVELQREIARTQSMVLDGRDIGTFVLPDAPYKFYLTATVNERARRRYLEQQAKGVDRPLEEYEAQIAARDKQDMEREFAPLRRAEDAVYVDSTGMKPQEVVKRIVNVVNNDELRRGYTFWMRAFYRLAKVVVTAMIHIGTPYRVVGGNLRGLKGPWLVCINHVAQWDALVTAEMFLPRKTSFMAKSSLFHHKAMNWIITALGAIPVRRGEADTSAIKKALNALEEGRVFAVFPEGTRNLKQDGSIAPLHTGAGLIAMKAKVPVLPIYIHHGGKYRFLHPFTVYMGQPVELSDLMGKRINNSLLEEVMDRIYQEMTRLKKIAEKR